MATSKRFSRYDVDPTETRPTNGDPMYRDRKRVDTVFTSNVHPSAYISRDAQLDYTVVVEANASIFADSIIAAGAIIREGATIGVGTRIGTGTIIGVGAHIGAHSSIGNGVRVVGLSEVRSQSHIADGTVVRTGAVFGSLAGGTRKN